MSENVKTEEFYDPLGVNDPTECNLDQIIDDKDFEVMFELQIVHGFALFLWIHLQLGDNRVPNK